MCFPKPPKVTAPAPLAAPAAAGADNILLGNGILSPTDQEELRARGLQGRQALRIGRGRGAPSASSAGRGTQSGGGFSTLTGPGSIFIGSGAGGTTGTGGGGVGGGGPNERPQVSRL